MRCSVLLVALLAAAVLASAVDLELRSNKISDGQPITTSDQTIIAADLDEEPSNNAAEDQTANMDVTFSDNSAPHHASHASSSPSSASQHRFSERRASHHSLRSDPNALDDESITHRQINIAAQGIDDLIRRTDSVTRNVVGKNLDDVLSLSAHHQRRRNDDSSFLAFQEKIDDMDESEIMDTMNLLHSQKKKLLHATDMIQLELNSKAKTSSHSQRAAMHAEAQKVAATIINSEDEDLPSDQEIRALADGAPLPTLEPSENDKVFNTKKEAHSLLDELDTTLFRMKNQYTNL